MRRRACAGDAVPERAQIVPIQRQDQVEPLELCQLDHSRTQAGPALVAPCRRLARAPIRWLADLIARAAGRVDCQLEIRNLLRRSAVSAVHARQMLPRQTQRIFTVKARGFTAQVLRDLTLRERFEELQPESALKTPQRRRRGSRGRCGHQNDMTIRIAYRTHRDEAIRGLRSPGEIENKPRAGDIVASANGGAEPLSRAVA